MNKEERENLDKIYQRFEQEGQEALEKHLTASVSPKERKFIREGLKRLAEESKKADEAQKELKKTVDSIPKRSPLRADIEARLANIETKKRIAAGETKTGLSEEELNLNKGLKKFFYGENFVWARNQKNADRKAKNLKYV